MRELPNNLRNLARDTEAGVYRTALNLAARRLDQTNDFLKEISEREGKGCGLFAGDLQREIKDFLEPTK